MKVSRKIISVILVLLMTVSLSLFAPFVGAETTNPNTSVNISGKSVYGYAFEVLRQLNELRASLGLSPLKMNPQMLEDAMQRSAELTVKFSHTRPDGSSCFTINSEIMGENIAMGYSTPTDVMQGWINSPGHYANMVTSYYDSVGIGAVSHNGVMYWTQIFGISDTPEAETPDEISEKDFSVYLGENTYTANLILPESLYAGDRAEIEIRGRNSDENARFILNSKDFELTSSDPEVLIATNDEIIALSEGSATITAKSPALTLSAQVNVKSFSESEDNRCGDNITWRYEDKTLIFSGTGKMYDYETIFKSYDEITTNVPWKNGFYHVEKIVIEEGITSVGSYAFSCFARLSEAELPSSLLEISEGAFERCTSLPSIHIPEKVETIDEAVFENCYSLGEVNIPEGVKEISPYLFSCCYALESVKLSDSTERIGSGAFIFCSELSKINFPESLNYIGSGAFYCCEKITEVTIPKGVKEVFGGTFRDCDSLQTVTIHNPILDFGINEVFPSSNENLTIYGYKFSSAEAHSSQYGINFVPFDSAKLSAEVSDIEKIYDGITVTEDPLVNLTSTPDEYTVIYSRGETFDFDECFDSIKAITERFVTSGYYDADKTYLTNSGEYPISYCIAAEGFEVLTGTILVKIGKFTPEFSFEKEVVEIPYHFNYTNYAEKRNTLKDLHLLREYDITYSSDNEAVAASSERGSVSSKGLGECTITATFEGDENINPHSASYKVITYPLGRYTEGDFVFDFKEDRSATLTDYYGFDEAITVPTSSLGYDIEEISHGAFYSATLGEVTIPEGITHIGTSAFSSCTELQSISLPESLSTIDEYAFNFCKSLEEITIPHGVSAIMDRAFLGCGLKSIYIPPSVTYIGERAFGYDLWYYGENGEKIDDFIIYGVPGSEAERYALENGFKFIDPDAPLPLFALGDVNRDGSVNIKDATAIQKHIAGLISLDSEQVSLADFNGDGTVNIKDATQIQKKIAGLI